MWSRVAASNGSAGAWVTEGARTVSTRGSVLHSKYFLGLGWPVGDGECHGRLTVEVPVFGRIRRNRERVSKLADVSVGCVAQQKLLSGIWLEHLAMKSCRGRQPSYRESQTAYP